MRGASLDHSHLGTDAPLEILPPVSRGSSFEDAVRLAIDTAKSHGGRGRVLNVVDAAEIRRIEAGARPGAIHLARHAADEVRKRMTDEGMAAVVGTVRRFEAAGVPARGEGRGGGPARGFVGGGGG